LKLAFPAAVNMPRPAPQHEVATNLDIARQFSGDGFGSVPELFLTEEDRRYAARVLDGVHSQYVVVSVAFGAQAKKRIWPLDLWVETIGLLASSRPLFVLLVCSKGEMKQAAYLKGMLNSAHPKVEVSIVSGARLRESAACLEASHLFIGGDSGPAHLAAAVQCPTLVISPHPLSGDEGHANSPVRFRPWSDRGLVLQPDIATAPCSSSCEHLRPHCILRITPAEVAAAAEGMLSGEDKIRPVSVQSFRRGSYSDSTI
jgi:heptosyltransferase-2